VEKFVPVVDLKHRRIEVTVPEEMIEMANLKSNKQTPSKQRFQNSPTSRCGD